MAKPLPPLVRLHLTGLRLLLVFTVICGIAYPLLITGIGELIFPGQANGSQVRLNGRVVGSSLLGQNFTLRRIDPKAPSVPDPRWFQPRPSAAGADGYDPTASGASNLGPNDTGLTKTVQARRLAIALFDGVRPSSVPPDAVTGSGSGLDPDISPAYAYEQVNRVAHSRRLPVATVRALVADHVDGRVLGFLGQQRVNVVALNLALARLG
ncbi:potassium-transporting ATPase subunit C [Streptacidiphilus pinicola]|uniref:Potassium-transporting ATPase KdpC subunit n=1 Tax=Streptacidiphilus pinicola TaxID=2219663 RepID=A0A2X0JH93_9ACTN|nr:potassium-transporting ATPase subunit KdpC [Streptacidiphilus pinicola]RAG87048.1 potassium-transporting ATPase subunit C [Streptacidiphilus pinicola]